MPDLGVALPADEVEATLTALGSLRATHPCFLVCNVDLRDDDAPLEAERIPADVQAISARVLLEIIVPRTPPRRLRLSRRP